MGRIEEIKFKKKQRPKDKIVNNVAFLLEKRKTNNRLTGAGEKRGKEPSFLLPGREDEEITFKNHVPRKRTNGFFRIPAEKKRLTQKYVAMFTLMLRKKTVREAKQQIAPIFGPRLLEEKINPVVGRPFFSVGNNY